MFNYWKYGWVLQSKLVRNHQSYASRLVLGIESTFDDSGAAVVDENGKILGESLRSQLSRHGRPGKLLPHVAVEMHRENIPIVVKEAMSQANVDFKDLSALATAIKPGFSSCLEEGLRFSRQLVEIHKLPFIGVHHMEAHALTARMITKVAFPFLVLLTSGGHCLLCLARGLGDFLILGNTMDMAPGSTFEKTAKCFAFLNEEMYQKMSGGQFIEHLSTQGTRGSMPFNIPLEKGFNERTLSCNFSFSGLVAQAMRQVNNLKDTGDMDLQNYFDLARGFQDAVVQHLLNQLDKGIIFCKRQKLLPNHATLVVSGGVSANQHLRSELKELCDSVGFQLVLPPLRLCTDNGVMIAWTGMEYLLQGVGLVDDIKNTVVEPKSPLGPYIGELVIKEKIPTVKRFSKNWYELH